MMLDKKLFLDTNLSLRALGVSEKDGLEFPFPVPEGLFEEPVRVNIRPYAVPDKKRTPNIKNVIAVASGKGGVGKSTVAVNLAVAIAQMGASVGLLDGDIYGPSIPTMLGAGKAPAKDGKIVPLNYFGVKAMSMGYLVGGDMPMVWRGPMASGALLQMFNDTDWGELDYLIIDLPPGTGDIQLTLAQKLPVTGAVIVTTPQDVALADVKKALCMLDKVDIPVLGLVENMSTFSCPHCHQTTEIFGRLSKAPFGERTLPHLGKLPLTIETRTAGDVAKPAALTDKMFEKLALHTLARLALRPRDLRINLMEGA